MLCVQARTVRAACADAVRRPAGALTLTPSPGAQVWRGEMAVPGVAAGYELVADYTAGHPAMAAMLGHGTVCSAGPAPMPAHPRITSPALLPLQNIILDILGAGDSTESCLCFHPQKAVVVGVGARG